MQVAVACQVFFAVAILLLHLDSSVRCVVRLECRLAAVHLVDAHLAADPGKFLAAALLSLTTMLHLELPHVNALSKVLKIRAMLRITDWKSKAEFNRRSLCCLARCNMRNLMTTAFHVCCVLSFVEHACAHNTGARSRMQVDLVAAYGRPAFGLDFYTQVAPCC